VVPALTVAALIGGACGPALGSALGVPLPLFAVPILALLAAAVGLAVAIALVIGEDLPSRVGNASFMAGGACVLGALVLVGSAEAAFVLGAIVFASAAVLVSLHHLALCAGPGIAVAHLFMFAGMASGGLVGGILHDRLLVPGLAVGGWLTLLQFHALALCGRPATRVRRAT